MFDMNCFFLQKFMLMPYFAIWLCHQVQHKWQYENSVDFIFSHFKIEFPLKPVLGEGGGACPVLHTLLLVGHEQTQ